MCRGGYKGRLRCSRTVEYCSLGIGYRCSEWMWLEYWINEHHGAKAFPHRAALPAWRRMHAWHISFGGGQRCTLPCTSPLHSYRRASVKLAVSTPSYSTLHAHCLRHCLRAPTAIKHSAVSSPAARASLPSRQASQHRSASPSPPPPKAQRRTLPAAVYLTQRRPLLVAGETRRANLASSQTGKQHAALA